MSDLTLIKQIYLLLEKESAHSLSSYTFAIANRTLPLPSPTLFDRYLGVDHFSRAMGRPI